MLSPAFEVLFGGSAGGGKSDLLLGLARYCHRMSVIFRRTFPDLEHSVIPRSKEFYGDTGGYNGSKHAWSIDGRIIWFSHLEKEDSVFAHQSAQYDFIGFDELTQFTEKQYTYLTSRARSTKPGQRVRIVSATNPGGVGSEWVIRHWAPWLDETYPKPAAPGELRYFKRAADGKTEIETGTDDPDGLSRTYVPARLADNPFLGDDYRRQLNALPEPFRSQLLFGDWKAGMQDADYQVIPSAYIRDAILRWREWEKQGFPGRLTALGNDVGGGGAQGDKSTIAETYDQVKVRSVEEVKIIDPDMATMEVCGQLATRLDRQRGAAAYIDVVGIGAGVYHRAREIGLPAHAFKAGAATDLRDRSNLYGFANWRACAWWLVREMLEPGSGFNICLPPDQTLYNDLITPRFTYSSRGEIVIESKDLIRRRYGKSTDYADAVIQSIVGPLLVEEEALGRVQYRVHDMSEGY